jgi:AAA15 family ATPase/GTPase
LQRGGILVVDEFDASIHPMALMNIITLFHNDELNTHKAQLVFNTHNPIFLNSTCSGGMRSSSWIVMMSLIAARTIPYLISALPARTVSERPRIT